MAWAHPESVKGMLACWPRQRRRDLNLIGHQMWNVIPATLWWLVWEEQIGDFFRAMRNSHEKFWMIPNQELMIGCSVLLIGQNHLLGLGFLIGIASSFVLFCFGIFICISHAPCI